MDENRCEESNTGIHLNIRRMTGQLSEAAASTSDSRSLAFIRGCQAERSHCGRMRNATKSAICAHAEALSKPSGIGERGSLKNCAMSRRSGGGADLLLQRFTYKLEQRLRRRIVQQAEILVKLAVVGFLGR